MVREYIALAEEFSRAQIPMLFVKGLPLAALIYRSPMLKMGWDIDIVVQAADLTEAARALANRGFEPAHPSREHRLERWHKLSKESVWRRPDGVHVELHTRLSDNPGLIPGIGAHSPSQQVELVPGGMVATLARDELFAYLSVHGASSAWFRLKWITDFAAFVARFDGTEVERLYARSQQLGAGRAAGQALLLADRLYGTLRGLPDLKRELERDRGNRRLAEIGWRMLEPVRQPAEPTERRFGTVPIHLSQLLLQPSAGFKFAEGWRQLRVAFANRTAG
jgi:hypothetical protein